ncbi:hypothetical protein MTO96_011300 [Rhipicephalus appendiculatus]
MRDGRKGGDAADKAAAPLLGVIVPARTGKATRRPSGEPGSAEQRNRCRSVTAASFPQPRLRKSPFSSRATLPEQRAPTKLGRHPSTTPWPRNARDRAARAGPAGRHSPRPTRRCPESRASRGDHAHWATVARPRDPRGDNGPPQCPTARVDARRS